ncbi:hypothetical protein ZWY2020_048182 [Hordeum vulgare]|nr:hypothetical protein ZWY2020_048182 [Hordeum vulgare]
MAPASLAPGRALGVNADACTRRLAARRCSLATWPSSGGETAEASHSQRSGSGRGGCVCDAVAVSSPRSKDAAASHPKEPHPTVLPRHGVGKLDPGAGISSQKRPKYNNPGVEMSASDVDDSAIPDVEMGSDQQVEPTTRAGDMSHTNGTSSSTATTKKSNREARYPNNFIEV